MQPKLIDVDSWCHCPYRCRNLNNWGWEVLIAPRWRFLILFCCDWRPSHSMNDFLCRYTWFGPVLLGFGRYIRYRQHFEEWLLAQSSQTRTESLGFHSHDRVLLGRWKLLLVCSTDIEWTVWAWEHHLEVRLCLWQNFCSNKKNVFFPTRTLTSMRSNRSYKRMKLESSIISFHIASSDFILTLSTSLNILISLVWTGTWSVTGVFSYSIFSPNTCSNGPSVPWVFVSLLLWNFDSRFL